jgi:hypothetical protein
MSLSGTTNTYLPPTLDGLNIIDADAIYINGIPIDTENLVPYTNATKNINLGAFNFQTLGSITAKQHVFPSFGSTMMTGAMTSSIFYADAWSMNNTLAISSLGGGSFVSTSYLRMTDGSNNSTLLTLQSDGIADFANSKVRISTMAISAYDVVNLSTLTSAVAYVEGITSLNFVPYVGALNNLNMGASTIKTTGYVSTAYLTLSEATNSEAWTLYTLSTMGNLSTLGGLVIQEKGGNSVYLTGGVVGAKNFQFSSPGNAGKVVCTDGNSVMSTTISAGQLQYINALHSNAGGIGETNTWSNTQTFSVAPTLNGLTTTTPSFSLGVDGSNQVIKFTPPTATNLLPLNNTWTGATNTFNDVVAGRVTTPAHTTYDNRAISPSDIPINSHKFYFGEMDNSANGSPYADVIGMQGWADGSGGNSNLLMINKNAIGMRVFQGTFGSTSPFSTYKDVQMVESNGDVIMGGSLSLGTRLLGSPDASPSGNFWMGLRGSGTEADRLAIAIAGNATTGAVSLIGLSKPTTISATLTVTETALIGFTAIPTTYPFTGNKDLYVNGSIYSAGTNAMVATFGRNTTGTPYNEITFTAGGAGVLLSQIKSHTTGASIVDATWTYSNTNANPLGANQGQVLLTADSLTASVANGFAVAGSYIIKLGTTAGYDVRIEGGTATNSGYINFYSAGVSRGYLGNATGADLDLVAQGGAQLNFYTAGVKNLKIDTTGNLTMTHQKSLFLYDFGASNNAGIKSEATGDLSIFTGTAGVSTRMTIGRDGNVLLTGNLQMTITQPIYLYNISATNNAGIKCVGSGDMEFFTGTSGVSTRLTIQGGGNMLHTSGDTSYVKYGPNSTWSASLIVGSGPDRSGAGVAGITCTNGNLHADAGNNNSIYYGFYASARGTPNPHYFYGNDYNFIGVPQNYSPYSHVCVFAGDQMRRSQCMMRQIYREESINWSGGINMTYAFYKYNAQCPVKISGKYSCYSTFVGMQEVGLRLYCQSTGAIINYGFKTYQNLTYVQTTYPFEIILSEGDLGAFNLGWFDLYMYGVAGLVSTDTNNQLHVCVQMLPVNSF